MHYIYLIQNTINKKVYVGQTNNPDRRFSAHKNGAFYRHRGDYNMPFYRAVRKYGWDKFECSLIEQWDTLEECNEAEEFWISYLGCRDASVGYNIQKGGKVIPMTADQKAKLSLARKGKPGNVTGKTWKLSDKAIGNISKAHRKISDTQIKQLKLLLDTGLFCRHEICALYGVDRKTVYKNLKDSHA